MLCFIDWLHVVFFLLLVFFQIALVQRHFIFCMLPMSSEWLYIYPIVFRGSLICVHLFHPLEINLKLTGTRLPHRIECGECVPSPFDHGLSLCSVCRPEPCVFRWTDDSKIPIVNKCGCKCCLTGYLSMFCNQLGIVQDVLP